MKRILVVLGCVAMGMLATPATAGAESVIVQDTRFTPDDVTLSRPGAAVDWDWAGGAFEHNVLQDDRIFRSGNVTSSASASFQRNFSAGTFHYYCENHGSAAGGMDGVIRVRPSTTGAPAGLPFTVRWATSTTNTGGLFDVQFRVNDGRWRNWKRDTAKVRARFGVSEAPVRVRDGRTYTFRARSQVGATTAPSGWSPTVSREG